MLGRSQPLTKLKATLDSDDLLWVTQFPRPDIAGNETNDTQSCLLLANQRSEHHPGVQFPKKRESLSIAEWSCSIARLSIYSEYRTPDEIGRFVGLPGDHTRDLRSSRAEPGTSGEVLGRYHSWSIESQLPAGATPEAHLENLLARIGGASDRIAALAADRATQHVYLSISRAMDRNDPDLSLSPEAIARIAALGSGLEIFTWVVS
jgi:hypothetical protein